MNPGRTVMLFPQRLGLISTDPHLSWEHFVPNYTFLITICVTKLCVRPFLSTLSMARETELFVFPPWMSAVGFAVHTKASTLGQSAPIDLSRAGALGLQLVSGQNERETIVKSSPQSSSLLLLFPAKSMHHRAGSAECLRLTVYGIPS